MTAPSEHDWTVITLEGEVDLTRIDELEGLIKASPPESGAFMVIDLSPVTFMDSSGLNWLIRTEATISEVGGTCALVVPDGQLARLFKVAGLDSHFRIHRTMAELADAD